MDRIEKNIKDYSTKKLKEIVEQQNASYSPNFIDYAKDELIKRGETFPFNEEWIKEITEMSDVDLKYLVEHEYDTYHLEYIEIARKEYLKRGFKNETEASEQKETFEKRFPALRTIAGFISFFAWAFAIITAIGILYAFENISKYDNGTAFIYLVAAFLVGAFFFVFLLSQAEIIRVFVDIEENTRKYADYYKDNNEKENVTSEETK